MGVKPGYKLTQVGLIPEEWEVKPLGKFIALQRGHDLTERERRSGEVPVMGSAGPNGFHDTAIVRGPSVVLGRSGASFGQAHYCASDFWPHNTALYVTDFFGNHPLFSFYLLKSIDFSRHNSGGAQQSLNRNFIAPILVVVPNRKDQETIADALSDTDLLIESIEQLIAKKRRLKQAGVQDLLSGKKRLPAFSGDWETSPLRRFVQGFIVPMRDKPKQLTGDSPWCRIEDFDGIYLTGSKSGQGVDLPTVRAMNLKVYPTGTLLVSCSADLGRCAIVAHPLVSNQTFIGLEMDETLASNLFFYYYMTSKAEELNNLSSGTTITYLSREQFEEFDVFVPSDKQEQTAIAMVLSGMDAEIFALDAKLAKARQLKHGMMQELLIGRMRLV